MKEITLFYCCSKRSMLKNDAISLLSPSKHTNHGRPKRRETRANQIRFCEQSVSERVSLLPCSCPAPALLLPCSCSCLPPSLLLLLPLLLLCSCLPAPILLPSSYFCPAPALPCFCPSWPYSCSCSSPAPVLAHPSLAAFIIISTL